MIFLSSNVKEQRDALSSDPHEFFDKWNEVKRLQDQKALILIRLWPLVLVATIFPSLWTVELLIKSFLRILLKSSRNSRSSSPTRFSRENRREQY